MKYRYHKSIVFLVLVCVAAACAIKPQSETLVWSDEFEVEGLPDPMKWTYDVGSGCELPCGCGWGNNELQSYTEKDLKTARVEGGNLIIECHPAFRELPITSARLTTKNKASWTYGTFEIKAKVAKGLGTWSAIWMLPEYNKYGGWPNSGEIDIMEHVGYSPDSVVCSAHTASYNHMEGTHRTRSLFMPDVDENFHIYKLVWSKEKYQIMVDEQLVFEFKKESHQSADWPFDQPFHLILNLAFGGNWGGKNGVDPDDLPAQLAIDYVRVYQ